VHAHARRRERTPDPFLAVRASRRLLEQAAADESTLERDANRLSELVRMPSRSNDLPRAPWG
jgi:hypothetical protein